MRPNSGVCALTESNLANQKPLVRILKEKAHLVDLEWNMEEQEKPNTLVERSTSRGASAA
jgi:hypothetical protein